jgi:hypothetical protein
MNPRDPPRDSGSIVPVLGARPLHPQEIAAPRGIERLHRHFSTCFASSSNALGIDQIKNVQGLLLANIGSEGPRWRTDERRLLSPLQRHLQSERLVEAAASWST